MDFIANDLLKTEINCVHCRMHQLNDVVDFTANDLLQGRFYVGAGGGTAPPPNVGQAPPPNILVPTAKIRILKI